MILLESEGSDAGCHCEADRQRRSQGAETMDGRDMRPQLLAPDSGHYEAASDRGGERAADMYSLIESAKLAGLDTEAHLRDILARIADHPINRITDLPAMELAALSGGRRSSIRARHRAGYRANAGTGTRYRRAVGALPLEPSW